jgi:hypothetical protein
MKATIYISGQINGNFRLKNVLDNGTAKSTIFNGFAVSFDTKKEAKKALWEAFKDLRSEDNKPYNLSYSKGSAIYYDASKAIIE